MAAKFRARTNPGEIVVVVIDYQSSYGFPYFAQSDNGTVWGWKLRLELVRALVSGTRMQFFTIANNRESKRTGECFMPYAAVMATTGSSLSAR